MAKHATLRLRPDRTGIEYHDEPIEGFPYLNTMTHGDQVHVARWAQQLAPERMTDERGFRLFEAPAAIVAFALRDRKQHERQFYADMGTHEHPLVAVRDAVN